MCLSPRESESFSLSFSLPRWSLAESVARSPEDTMSNIYYSSKYYDDKYEYRWVQRGQGVFYGSPFFLQTGQPSLTSIPREIWRFLISRRYLCARFILFSLFVLCFFLVFSHSLRLPRLRTCRNTSFKWPNRESSRCQFALLLNLVQPKLAFFDLLLFFCLNRFDILFRHGFRFLDLQREHLLRMRRKCAIYLCILSLVICRFNVRNVFCKIDAIYIDDKWH